ncbi:hypothetical protein GS500_26030 [Rhodococcus hoagii]|nr:hypothetical protein [Prescottella equi]
MTYYTVANGEVQPFWTDKFGFFSGGWNRSASVDVEQGMDPIEAAAIRAEGYDPDDPAVREALDFVRWELQLLSAKRLGGLLRGIQ